MKRAVRVCAATAMIVIAVAASARAQLVTPHVKGSVGLKAGSQPPPGGYVAAPVLYFYTADEVKVPTK